MTELAYTIREDWAQRGTAMQQQSARIRDWLGQEPYLFATADLKQYGSAGSADREFVEYLADVDGELHLVDFSALSRLRRRDSKALTIPLIGLHPHKQRDCESLREIVESDSVEILFIIVWSSNDMVRHWLDGLRAVNLHTGSASEGGPDAVQLEAAKCWVDEQYNGLSSGNGKAAVVQLLREFTSAGYSLDADTWLNAFFAAGGTFSEARNVAQLIAEMQAGIQHRIKPRYRPEILSVLTESASESA